MCMLLFKLAKISITLYQDMLLCTRSSGSIKNDNVFQLIKNSL